MCRVSRYGWFGLQSIERSARVWPGHRGTGDRLFRWQYRLSAHAGQGALPVESQPDRDGVAVLTTVPVEFDRPGGETQLPAEQLRPRERVALSEPRLRLAPGQRCALCRF